MSERAPAGRFRTVDGLRGIAAMAVVLFHLDGATRETFGAWLPSALANLFAQGHYGVDIFFVLSGFVIAYSIRTAAPTLGFVGRFAVRRSIRLDPPYWAAIALEVAVQWVALRLAFSDAPLPSVKTLVAHVFYLQNLLGLGNVVDVFWTLCFEIQFYLGLTLLMVAFERSRGMFGDRPAERLALVFLAGSFLYSIAVRFGIAGLGTHEGFALLRWYQFLLGACVWWVVAGRARPLALFLAWSVLAVVVVADGSPLLELLPIGVSALLWAAHRRDGMRGWLSSRPLQFLGAISYSLYLFHATIGWRFVRLLGEVFGSDAPVWAPPLAFVLGVALCVVSAWLAWQLLERPSLVLAQRIALPRRAMPHALAAPAARQAPVPSAPR